MDNRLPLSENITAVTRACRFFLYNIGRIRPFLTTYSTKLLLQVMVLSCLDYCNSQAACYSIKFKTLVLAYQAVKGSAAAYIQQLIRPYTPARPLRSTTSGRLVPKLCKIQVIALICKYCSFQGFLDANHWYATW